MHTDVGNVGNENPASRWSVLIEKMETAEALKGGGADGFGK